MDKLSICVEALKDVRRNLHSETDPSSGEALDAIIAKIEGSQKEAETDEVSIQRLAAEALMVLSSLLNYCSAMAKLIERFRD